MLEKPSEIKMDRVEVPVGEMAAFDSYAVECPRFPGAEWTTNDWCSKKFYSTRHCSFVPTLNYNSFEFPY